MTPTLDSVGQAFQATVAEEFALERELGRGGMGIVYLARDLRLDRAVAIKVLPPALASDAEMRERFLREARTAAQLAHPNIVPIYRAEEAHGFAWFVMGFVDGETLGERIRSRGPLPPPDAIRILREVAWALAYAHARGIVHRDVKPENVLLERGTGRALVTDFGIARRESNPALTQDGMILGTVHYMSPEQVEGRSLDGRSDLYSLGVVGYYALSARLPFEDEVPSAVVVAHATRPAPPLATVAPELPAALAQVIDRCLLKNPVERYPDGESLAEALGSAASVTPPAFRAGGSSAPAVVNELQAQAIWRRAAELQAEATIRLQARLKAPGETLASATEQTGGYRAELVEAAAVEAGISPEYVALAMSELATATPEEASSEALRPFEERIVTGYLQMPERSLSVTRRFAASPRTVLSLIGKVFPAYPFELRLRDAVGGHPLDGGFLLFEVPSWYAAAGAGDTGQAMYFKYYLHSAKVSLLRVRLHAIAGAPESSEVTLSADLRPGLRSAARWLVPSVGSGMLGGGAGGFAIGAAAMGLGAGLAVLPGLLGAGLIGGLVAGTYRIGVRWTQRKAREKLDELLTAIDTQVRSQSLFGVASPTPAPRRRGSGDGGFSFPA